MIRFSENKNYTQGIFYTNNNKIDKTSSTTTLERQSRSSNKKILTDDLEIQNLDNTEDNILVKEVQLNSE